MAFPAGHRLAGEDSDRICESAKTSGAPTNSVAAGNSLPVVDSAWFWCGSNCNADEKEKRKIIAPWSQPDTASIRYASKLRFAVLLSACVSLATTSLCYSGL